MNKRRTKQYALLTAVIWTVAAMSGCLHLFRNGGNDPLSALATLLFTVNAAIWWLRWYRSEDDSKKQEEQNHE